MKEIRLKQKAEMPKKPKVKLNGLYIVIDKDKREKFKSICQANRTTMARILLNRIEDIIIVDKENKKK